MGLRDDLQNAPVKRTAFEKWIDTLEAEDVEALHDAGRDTTRSDSDIWRAVRANGYPVGKDTIAAWRRTIAS